MNVLALETHNINGNSRKCLKYKMLLARPASYALKDQREFVFEKRLKCVIRDLEEDDKDSDGVEFNL